MMGLWEVVRVLAVVGLLALVVLLLLRGWVVWRTRRRIRGWGFNSFPYRPVLVGFFHPYCNSGGGGERVLWHSICALQKRYSFVRCVVFTGDEEEIRPRDILNKVQERFGIVLSREVKFVYLKRRSWVEARRWPRFTMLGQSIGSVVLGFEALMTLSPHVYVDTMGYAFTLPLFRWIGGSKVASYVHYPLISRDMLEQVDNQVCTYNNAPWIGRSWYFTKLKLLYYWLFAKLYGFVGRRNDVVMVNSSWTHGHISELWRPKRLYVVYPPCDTSAFQQLSLDRPTKRNLRIVSVGQFRPEKNHYMQLSVLAMLLKRAHTAQSRNLCLVLVGSCRHAEDRERVDELKRQARKLGILDRVVFRINIPFEDLKQELSQATIALHTMWNEHFGIGLVESMAAGCVMVAHGSGGPLMDIVVDWQAQKTGFLATNEEEFVSHILHVLAMSDAERRAIACAARDSVQAKFSDQVFEASFLRATEHLFG